MVQSELDIVDAQRFQAYTLKLAKDVSMKGPLIYVTVNKPSVALLSTFRAAGVAMQNVFCIDAVSRAQDRNAKEPPNCVFLDNPESLTDIGIAITSVCKAIGRRATLIFDSLSALLIYNTPELVAQFINYLVNKLRQFEINTIIIALDSDMKRSVVVTITAVVDEVKEIGE